MDSVASEKLFVLAIAAATFVVVWAGGAAMAWRRPIEARLRGLSTRRMKTRREQEQARLSPKATSIGAMRRLAERLNLLRGAAADQTSRKLRRAGFHSRDAAVVYVFVKLALPLGLGFLMIVLTSGVIDMPDDLILPACIGAVLAGFVMPELYIKNVTARRREVLNYLLPEGLDLLTICVESGMSVEQAFNKVASELGATALELSEELQVTTAELSYLGDRRQALENFAERTNMPEVKAIVSALIQADKYGTPLGQALRVISAESRFDRMARAETKAASLPALLTVPMMLFFVPVLFVVIIGPAVIQTMQTFNG